MVLYSEGIVCYSGVWYFTVKVLHVIVKYDLYSEGIVCYSEVWYSIVKTLYVIVKYGTL